MQKVMSQIKGQDKAPEKQLSEVEKVTFQKKEFRIMIVKTIQDLWKTVEKMREMFTKDLEELKNKQMNNILEGIHSRITEGEEQINEGGQNGGSHCHRTEYRKTNEKK